MSGIITIKKMALSGHKTETTYMNYIEVTEKETAKMIVEHKFFQ